MSEELIDLFKASQIAGEPTPEMTPGSYYLTGDWSGGCLLLSLLLSNHVSTDAEPAVGSTSGLKADGDEVEDEDTIDYHDIMLEEYEQNDCRIAMIGNVDSGKSTLIGVLTNSALDDGRGSARSLVLKHRHEQENGRTSAVTVDIMGYRGEEQVIPTARNHIQRWAEVMEKSDHSVTLIDLCGHEKYLKTTLFGLTGLMPDYCLLVVGSNMGVQVNTSTTILVVLSTERSYLRYWCTMNVTDVAILFTDDDQRAYLHRLCTRHSNVRSCHKSGYLSAKVSTT